MLVGPESGPEVQKNGWVFVRRIGEAQHRPGVGRGGRIDGGGGGQLQKQLAPGGEEATAGSRPAVPRDR